MIENKISELGFKPVITNSELKSLPDILKPSEQLLALFEGHLIKIHNRDYSGTGLAIVTDKRFLLYRKSLIGSVTFEEIPIEKVSSVSYKSGFLSTSIIVYSSNNESVIKGASKTDAKRLVDALQRLIYNEREDIKPVTNTPIKNDVEPLQKLDKVTFFVQGSEDDPYKLEFEVLNGDIIFTCNCAAGRNFQLCKHRLSLIEEDFPGPNSKAVREAFRRSKAFPIWSELRETELLIEQSQTKLASLKKQLNRTVS